MRLLVLGGTKVSRLCRRQVRVQRGHHVTLFNGGHTNPSLFPEAKKLRGDRERDLDTLRGGDWDAEPRSPFMLLTGAQTGARAEKSPQPNTFETVSKTVIRR